MKLLIAGAKSKFFHLKEFGDIPKKAYQNFKNIPNLKICWGFNPVWDKVWSID